MLAISSDDIYRIVSRKEVADEIEKAMLLLETGNFIMPDRLHLHNGDNIMLAMPCFAEDVLSTKLVNIFPNNRSLGLPSLFGTLILNDGKTGEPLAIMNGATITSLRTGAVGGIGVRYLSKKDAKSIFIIGTGVQGRNLVLSSCIERQFEKIYAYDVLFENAEKFASKIQKELTGIKVIPVSSINDGLQKSDVVITATTSPTPVLPSDINLLEGKCFIGVGSFKPNTRELPEVLFSLTDSIFVDTSFANKECGDLAIPLASNKISDSNIFTIGKLIGKSCTTSTPTKVFKTVGIALFDLFAANLVYKRAIEQKVGTTLNL